MKAMMSGFIAMAVIAVGAYFVLHEAGFSSQESQSGANVRLD
jgi:hypothetical protein